MTYRHPGSAEKETYVRTLFDRIADRYDLMNLVMTGGMVKFWHRAFRRYTGLGPGGRVLDVACGTGDLSLVTADQVAPDGRVIGVDFSEQMLAVGRRRIARSRHAGRIDLRQGDALNLPFADDTFDCATIGFALRNVKDISLCLTEMTRVVRPGGRVVSLEISKPPNPVVRGPFYLYFYHVVPLIDRLVLGLGRGGAAGVRPYTYLPHSLTDFPDQKGLCRLFTQAGLADAGYRGLAGGVVSIHYGTKPAARPSHTTTDVSVKAM